MIEAEFGVYSRSYQILQPEKEAKLQYYYKTDTVSYGEYFYKSAMGMLKVARARQAPVMQVSVLVALYAEQMDESERDTKLLGLFAAKYVCQIRCLDLQQDETFRSVLPVMNHQQGW